MLQMCRPLMEGNIWSSWTGNSDGESLTTNLHLAPQRRPLVSPRLIYARIM